MAVKPLGHRALFGKGMRWDTICESLAPYDLNEVILVLTSLSALLRGEAANGREAQLALVESFFLESWEKLEPKVKANCVVFHRHQVLVGLRAALAHCRGDRGSQPTGTAFFEGIARALVAITDHLGAPSAMPKGLEKRPTRDQLQAHLNHLVAQESLLPSAIEPAVVRAHHMLFERSGKLSRHRAFFNLAGSFHERHGVQCERWFMACLHLLAKSLEYSLQTMHERQPIVRISSDFQSSAYEARQVERFFAPSVEGLGRAKDGARQSFGEEQRDALLDFEALRRKPIIRLLEDTYAATDSHLLCDMIAGELGSTLVATANERDKARHWWTSLVRDHAERLLPALTAPLRSADRMHRDEAGRARAIADWYHVRGGDALLIWVVTAPLRRDFSTDEALLTSNSRVVRTLLHTARQATTTIRAWRDGLCDLEGKRIGAVKRIFPMMILEQALPWDASAARLFARACKEEGLLQDAKAQPLVTLDIGTLEALTTAPKPPLLIALVAEHAGNAARSRPLRSFIEKKGLPMEPDAVSTRAQFEKLVKSCRKRLGVS